MVVFGHSCCIWSKLVLIGQIGIFRAMFVYSDKVIVLGKNVCIRAKWLYLAKMFVFGAKWLYSGKLVVSGQKWL